MKEREDIREQLRGLHRENDCFYGRSFGDKSDKISLTVGNSGKELVLTIGYWRNDPAFSKGFMIATDDEYEGLSGLSFDTAQAALEHVKGWCSEHGLKIRPFRQSREY